MNTLFRSPQSWERRRGSRLHRSFPVSCRQNGAFHPSSALDVSLTGLRLQTPYNFTVGSEITVHIRPVPSQSINLQARVVWCAPSSGSSAYQIGLHFTEGPTSDFLYLRKWVHEMEPAPINAPRLEIQGLPGQGASRTNGNGIELPHRCQCGAQFALRVELAVHCESQGHRPEALPPTPPEAAPPPRRSRRRTRLAVLLVLLALVSGTFLTLEALQLYTWWQASSPDVVQYL